MVPISDYEIYDTRMRKSLIDKAFFLDKTDAEVFVDFGCADGALIELLATLFPEHTYIGYDNDPTMLKLADRRIVGGPAGRATTFTEHSWDKVKSHLHRLRDRKSCLILSSVIHEVYNYSSDHEIEEFWDQVLNSGFDFVVVRDMARCWYEMDPITYEARELNPPTRVDWLQAVERGCRMMGIERRLSEFEERYGPITSERNLAHFLLKYRYSENWLRELEEDYFIASTLVISDRFPVKDWDSIFSENFALPFNVRQVRNDFGFNFPLKTHTKMIFERK
jgi:Trans-aconitate methyltransferase